MFSIVDNSKPNNTLVGLYLISKVNLIYTENILKKISYGGLYT